MNLIKDLWEHLKEWSDWKMKDCGYSSWLRRDQKS